MSPTATLDTSSEKEIKHPKYQNQRTQHKNNEDGSTANYILFFFILILIIVIIIFIYGIPVWAWISLIVIAFIAGTRLKINDHNDKHSHEFESVSLVPEIPVSPSDALDLGFGQPEFFKPFVQTNLLGNEQKIKEVDHLYFIEEPSELKSNIIKLHKEFPNCKTDGDLIISNGSIQLLTAFCWAVRNHVQTTKCHKNGNKKPIFLFYQTPGPDFLYRGIAKVAGVNVITDLNYTRSIDPEQLIEIINTPNNPDNKIHQSVTGAKWKLFDMGYAWRHFMDKEDWNNLIRNPINENCIFSASRLFGLAGSRIGWGFIKDKCLVSLIKEYILSSTLNWSRDGLNRVNIALINLISEKFSNTDISTVATSRRGFTTNEYFEVIRKVVVSRHTELSKRLNLINTPGPYGWVRKSAKEFENLNINVKPGEDFGVSNEFSRINLMASRPKFDELLRRLDLEFTNRYKYLD